MMSAENSIGPDRQRWFALRVKTRCEKLVGAMAHNRGFQEFVPLYRCRRRWSDRFKSVDLPLFPGYVFCRLIPERRLPLVTIPGVMHFVGLGRVPVPIEDAEIAAIQTAVGSGLAVEPWPYLTVGQRVRVQYGALAGLEGILVELCKQRRIVVSVNLLQRSVGVEIEADWVELLPPRTLRPSIPKVMASVAASFQGRSA